MKDDQARELFASMIHEIAPEIDLSSMDGDANLQEELDIDSVDFLNLVQMIHDITGLNVPETDYAKMSSINACITYLAARVS